MGKPGYTRSPSLIVFDFVGRSQASEILQRQIELEIALRARASAAASAKVQWAEKMREALVQSIQHNGGVAEHLTYLEALLTPSPCCVFI